MEHFQVCFFLDYLHKALHESFRTHFRVIIIEYPCSPSISDPLRATDISLRLGMLAIIHSVSPALLCTIMHGVHDDNAP